MNVIMILSDDMGEWAYGFLGNQEAITPNIDLMAKRGTVLRNFFCTSPVCSPARASLLTGLIPSQHGILDYVLVGNVGQNAVPYLRPDLAFTSVLSKAGYRCGLSGKWHLGDSMSPQQGFSHWYAHESSGGPYVGAKMVDAGRLVVVDTYVTDAIADDAIRFFSNAVQAEQPFFAAVNFTAPHAPWLNQHPKRFTDLFLDADFASCPQDLEHPWLRPLGPNIRQALKDPRSSLIGYFAAVAAMDEAVGRVLAEVDRLGIAEETLVILTTDNGFNAGHHGIWGKGNSTYPANMYDTSIRTPAVFLQPGRVSAGNRRNELVSAYDLRATLLGFLGIKDDLELESPGRDISMLLESDGSQGDANEMVVVFDEYGASRMIRTQEWKFVSHAEDGFNELYDLLEDPSERRNVVADVRFSRTANELEAELDAWFDRYSSRVFDGRQQQVWGTGQIRPIRHARDAGAFHGPKDPFA